MTDIIDSVQLQEIDDELVELFDIALPGFDLGDTEGNYHLFAGFDGDTTQVVFAGKTYIALPIQITGIEISSSGAISRPTLTIANIPVLAGFSNQDVDGNNDEIIGDVATLDEIRRDAEKTISNTEYLVPFETNDDLIGTKVVYRKTLKSKLGYSGSEQFPSETFYIDRLSSETNLFVTFELSSPMDIEGAQIPARMVIGRYCPWQYQGVALGFGGGCTWPISQADQNSLFFDYDNQLISGQSTWSSSTSYSAGNKVQITDNGHYQIFEALIDHSGKNPLLSKRYWKRIDLCGKTLTSCKKRFQGNSSNTNLDQDAPLPFGGFPGSKKYR